MTDDKGWFICDYCSYKTAKRNTLWKHRIHKHINQNATAAKRTSKSAKNAQDKNQAEKDSSNVKKTAREERLTEGGRFIYTTGEDGLYHCDTCSYKTAKKDTVKKHRALKHNKRNATNVTPARIYATDAKGLYLCDQCSFKTAKLGTVKGHIYRKHVLANRKPIVQPDLIPATETETPLTECVENDENTKEEDGTDPLTVNDDNQAKEITGDNFQDFCNYLEGNTSNQVDRPNDPLNTNNETQIGVDETQDDNELFIWDNVNEPLITEELSSMGIDLDQFVRENATTTSTLCLLVNEQSQPLELASFATAGVNEDIQDPGVQPLVIDADSLLTNEISLQYIAVGPDLADPQLHTLAVRDNVAVRLCVKILIFTFKGLCFLSGIYFSKISTPAF